MMADRQVQCRSDEDSHAATQEFAFVVAGWALDHRCETAAIAKTDWAIPKVIVK